VTGHHRFSLVPAERLIEVGASERTARRSFLDFAVDGEPLYPAIRRTGLGYITPLWLDAGVKTEVAASLARLLGHDAGDAPGGRVSVYIGLDDLMVTWSDWGWQKDYEDEVRRGPLSAFPALMFDRAEYEAILGDVLGRIADP
jgi:hypothetical protein